MTTFGFILIGVIFVTVIGYRFRKPIKDGVASVFKRGGGGGPQEH